MSEDLVKKFVRIWLAETETVRAAHDKAVAEAEAAGKTVVTMDQTEGYGEDGKAGWEVRDLLSGALLLSRRDTWDNFHAAVRAADPLFPVPGVDDVFPVSDEERAEIAELRAMAARLG